MKRFAYLPVSVLALCLLVSSNTPNKMQNDITGAWRIDQGSTDHIIVYKDGYFSQTVFDKANKIFIGTVGGTYKLQGNTVETKLEFSSKDKNDVGKEIKYSFEINRDELIIDMHENKIKMKRIDSGVDNLAGVWRITGRMQNGEIVQMQRGDRKTLKVLSGTRFQWLAINPVTKEFFGTGGGIYTFKDGKYTETIEFFSRDSSRVGASLAFDGSVKDDVWNHKGLSSKGDPINELWTKEKY